MNSVEQLGEWIKSAKSIVALTGAGISTGSGIPDFRSAGGIYSGGGNRNVFDLRAFDRTPEFFYLFARKFYPQVRDAEPNAAHRALAAMKNVTVVTQNVDDYHQRAGSEPVYTVHGSYINSICQVCGGQIETAELFPIILSAEALAKEGGAGNVPHCVCGGVYKPNITFFGEMLPEYDWSKSVEAISEADLVLVLGTSLAVEPAASLPGYRPRNATLVIINRDPTPLDHEAQLVIHDDLCEVMKQLI